MNFGQAIEAMKEGKLVQREGWNDKGIFCLYVPGTKPINFNQGTPYYEVLSKAYDEDCAQQSQEILPHIDMWTINAEGRRAMLPGWPHNQTCLQMTGKKSRKCWCRQWLQTAGV